MNEESSDILWITAADHQPCPIGVEWTRNSSNDAR